MANYKWPNVYPSIKDASGTMSTNSVTTCAYVGEAEFGPINKPTFLSSARDYTSTFGALNVAKYGYAGYSLAVAAESIDSHYFVRVVKAGTEGSHEADDAMYASVKIPAANSTATPTTSGWYVEEIDQVLKDEDPTLLFTTSTYFVSSLTLAAKGEDYSENDELTLMLDEKPAKVKVTKIDNEGGIEEFVLVDAGSNTTDTAANPIAAEGGTGADAKFEVTLSNKDTENALIFVANDPNNLKFYVTLTDSTVNENKAYLFESITYVAGTNPNEYIATVAGLNETLLAELTEDDTIEITRVNTDQNGVYAITSLDKQNRTLTYSYVSNTTPTDITMGVGKIGKYPEPSNRTFQVTVSQKIGRSLAPIETYQFCTLYPAKDAYGNSMYVEDVINGYSDSLHVYVNPNLLNTLAEDEVLEVSLSGATVALEGGQAGGRPSSKELTTAWNLFEDRNQISASILMNCGYTNKADTSYQNKMLEVAEKRRDCFCLFDIPMTEVEAEDAIDWRKNTLSMNSYRAALSSPWVKTYDSVQGRANFLMCPSAYIAKLIGQAGDPWHAPAGPNRGIINSAIVSPTGLTQIYDSEIGGRLYADNQINCLIRDVSAGYVNWGQRTLQAKPSALDRINVARTVIYIETVLRDAARWHLFENNTPYERMQVVLQFSQFLDTILSAEGITSYKVICDESNNPPIVIQNNQMVIDVILQPVYTAESIILNTTVTSNDASVVTTTSNLG